MKWLSSVVITFFLLSGVVNTSAQNADFLTNYSDCNFTSTEDENGLQLGVVILDFDTRFGCVQNLERVFNVASVPKILVAAAYYDGVINRTFNNSGRLQFTRNYWMGGFNDCLREEDIGNTYTYEQIVEFMINCSDNAATWMLMDAIGWETVNEYAQSLEIEGIGEVIPYSEVDRLKLAFDDEQWASVPAGFASRFYRARMTTGLLDYFSEIPERPNRDDFVAINQRYFDEYTYNTMTPQAMADFVWLMRDYLLSGTPEQWFVATSVFNVMLYTERQYSTQAMPGEVYVAGKNGFDRGLLAEVNIVFDDMNTRIPSGMVILFGQYESLSGGPNNGQLPNAYGDALNDLFYDLSPQVRDVLYPNYTQPIVQNNFQMTSVVLNDEGTIGSCWAPFRLSDFSSALVPQLETCFNTMRPRVTYPVGQDLGLGITLRNLNYADTRFTMLFTAPDGRQRSYQTDRQNTENAAIFWLHPLDMSGQWQVDIYMNLVHSHSETILAQR
ncbi:MAG: serine hydrolase [Chloroflexota bacterium]